MYKMINMYITRIKSISIGLNMENIFSFNHITKVMGFVIPVNRLFLGIELSKIRIRIGNLPIYRFGLYQFMLYSKPYQLHIIL